MIMPASMKINLNCLNEICLPCLQGVGARFLFGTLFALSNSMKTIKEWTKKDKQAVEARIYETYRARTIGLQESSNVLDINPETRVTWSEIRRYAEDIGFDLGVDVYQIFGRGGYYSKDLGIKGDGYVRKCIRKLKREGWDKYGERIE